MAPLVAIILAAGKGTRMKSDLVKVLHPLLGVPMLSYLIDLSVHQLKAQRTIVVVGYQADRIMERFKDDPIEFALQEEQLGTGHAVLKAVPLLQGFEGTILILCGDVPLVKASTLQSFIHSFEREGDALSVLTTELEDPSGYGRIVRDDGGALQRIVEEKDATEKERSIREINTGLYCVQALFLKEGLSAIGKENAQGEYYLTDLVAIARTMGRSCSAFRTKDAVEVMGINTRVDLAVATERLRQEKVRELMLSGVTLLDPRTTYIDRSVVVGRDTIIHPNCTLEGRTLVGERCHIEAGVKITDSILGDEVTIRSHCVITESRLENGVVIGPFAHLRPLTEVRSKAKIGNFVEVKKSVIGRGTKANHLTYLGDAVIGEEVNIGAGTITCNYDGFKKHPTIIGDRVFVGSNVEIVAPVRVGNDSSIGAGSTITRDVPEGALAISRVKQKTILGWRERQRRRREKED